MRTPLHAQTLEADPTMCCPAATATAVDATHKPSAKLEAHALGREATFLASLGQERTARRSHARKKSSTFSRLWYFATNRDQLLETSVQSIVARLDALGPHGIVDLLHILFRDLLDQRLDAL